MTRIFMFFLAVIILIIGQTNYLFAQNFHNKYFTPGGYNENQLKEHGHYDNKYGEDVHSPAHSISGVTPDGATALCADGEYSFSHTSSGTCSRHGGVNRWLR